MNAVMQPPVREQSVAQAMAQSRRWLLYRLIGTRGQSKPAKVPYYVNGRPRGTLPDKDEKGDWLRCPLDSAEDVAQLASYDEARKALEAGQGRYKGFGFALGPDGTGNFWQGVDFDKMSQHPQLTLLAKAMVGYRETSPSGDGMHWIGYGPTNFDALPNHQGVEAYSHGRFFTVTMKDVHDHPVVDLSDVVHRVLVPLRPDQGRVPKGGMFREYRKEPVTVEQLKELLKRIPIAKTGYYDWCDVLMGVHHQYAGTDDEEAAKAACNEWSSDDFRPGSYGGEKTVAKKWASFGRNPNLSKPGAPITIRTVKALAEKNTPFDLKGELQRMFAGSPAGPVPDPDPSTPGDAPAVTARRPFGAKHMSEFLSDDREQGWLIKGVLPSQGVAQTYGDTGVGKTFAVMDMMLSVAQGNDWCGHRVHQGNVVYVAAEGASGARKRFRAYGKHHGVDVAELPVIVLDEPPNILEEKQLVELAGILTGMGRVNLVVIDTLAQVMFGADENSSEGMGKAIANLTQLANLLNTTVMIVHHSGKNASLGARGWSGQKGALDAQFEVIKATDGQRGITVTKQKDGEMGKTYPFTLKVIPLGVDSDGDEITSCVAVMGMSAGPNPQNQSQPQNHPNVKGEWQQRVMTHVSKVLELGMVLPIEEVIEAVVNSVAAHPDKDDRRKDCAWRAINTLDAKGVISISGRNLQKFDPNLRAVVKSVAHTPQHTPYEEEGEYSLQQKTE